MLSTYGVTLSKSSLPAKGYRRSSTDGVESLEKLLTEPTSFNKVGFSV